LGMNVALINLQALNNELLIALRSHL